MAEKKARPRKGCRPYGTRAFGASHPALPCRAFRCRRYAADTVRQILLVSCWLVLGAGSLFGAEKPAKTVYDYALVDLDGKEVSLSAYKGKVLVIVNLARQSIFNEQNAMLDEIQKNYKDQGLVVVGVPSNDFGAQEPGTDADVQKVYSKDLHLGFPVFARVSVRGKDQVALYAFLTGDKKAATGGDVHWSYSKFVVDRTGKVVARFEPHILPNAPEVRVTIEDVLAGKFKAPAPKEDDKKDAGGENMAR
jgi:glutathione peroxidase